MTFKVYLVSSDETRLLNTKTLSGKDNCTADDLLAMATDWALLNVISLYFPEGFGIRYEDVGNLDLDTLGRRVYCSGRFISTGAGGVIEDRSAQDCVFEITVRKN